MRKDLVGAWSWITVGVALIALSGVAFAVTRAPLCSAGGVAGVLVLQRGLARRASTLASDVPRPAPATPVDPDHATRMRLEFVVAEGDEALFRDTVILCAEEATRSYHVTFAGEPRVYQVKYAFGDPPSLWIEGAGWSTAFAMGVYASTEWESIGMGSSGTLAFKQTPLP